MSLRDVSREMNLYQQMTAVRETTEISSSSSSSSSWSAIIADRALLSRRSSIGSFFNCMLRDDAFSPDHQHTTEECCGSTMDSVRMSKVCLLWRGGRGKVCLPWRGERGEGEEREREGERGAERGSCREVQGLSSFYENSRETETSGDDEPDNRLDPRVSLS